MNEVVPWSTRARDALAVLASRLRAVVGSGWNWFTGLGQGSWLLTLAVVIALGIGVAVYQGHGDSGASPCQPAQPYVASVLALNGQPSLTSSQVNQLHADSAHLSALAKDAAGETRTAIAYAAQVSGDAQQGRPFDAGFTEGRFASACSFGSGFGGGPRSGVG